jgi:ornithine carbamoyltransferase
MCHSWVQASARFGFELRIACPEGLAPDPEIVAWAKGEGAMIQIASQIDKVVRDADVIMTDTWVSMNDNDEDRLRSMLQPYQVTQGHMKSAAENAIFLHCLPAHRGEEVASDVIDGPQSVVWDEAENRIHAQKAILAWCLR